MSGTQRLIAGRYRLRHPLADGGFGRVWHAHDERLDADVVVKEVRLPPAADPNEHARRLKYAEREARNAAKLRHHPCIVPVYDVAIEDERPWIVMELIEGGSLENRLAKGRLSPDEAAEVAEALLNALDAAHQAGIVHRDVKPANIMLAADGRILLTDFGIASHQADTRLTTEGAVIGTLEYLAPERLGGAPVAAASDLFSLGVTLFRAVEGTSPFLRDSQAATLAALAMEEPPPPKRAGQLGPLILGLLAKDPDARLTVTDALDLLRRRHLIITTSRQPQPPTTTMQIPKSDGPFEMAWTGQEPLKDYTEMIPRTSWRTFKRWAQATVAVSGLLTATGLVIGTASGWNGKYAVPSGVILAFAFIVLCLAGALAERTDLTKKAAQLPRRIPGWTLHVGPNYIVTTDAIIGRREFAWDRITKVTIEAIPHQGPYQFTGLFVAAQLAFPPKPRPVGWPHRVPPSSSFWARIPICVLGPLTHEQRTELSEALTRYGGSRWNPQSMQG